MKKIIAFFMFIFALAGYAGVDAIGSEDISTPVTIIVDVLQVQNNGEVGYNVQGDIGQTNLVADGFAFLTQEYYDVEDAAKDYTSICSHLWEIYTDNANIVYGFPKRTAMQLAAVSYALTFNNRAIQQSFSTKVGKAVSALRNLVDRDYERNTQKLEEIKTSQTQCSEQINNITKDATAKYNQIKKLASKVQTEVVQAQAELASIQRALSSSTAVTPEQLQTLQVQFNNKLAEAAQKSQTAGLTKVAEGQVLDLISMSAPNLPEITAQVATYSNQMTRLNKYLGFEDYTDEDSGEEHKNLGMFTEPNKKGGGKAGNINEYLNSFGVIAYKAKPEEGAEGEGEEEESNPFQGFTETENENVTASFKAPVNWADGVTIKCTNGVFSAEIPKVDYVTTPWHYSAKEGKWLRPYVFAGNQMITASGADASSSGTYYVNVTFTGDGWSAAISKTQTENESTWSFWVGTLESVEVDGQLSLVSAGELGAMPIILCYE